MVSFITSSVGMDGHIEDLLSERAGRMKSPSLLVVEAL